MLAGGQSLVPMLNLRLARFEHLVDIGRVAELRGIERRNGHVAVGAATRDVGHRASTPTIAADVPLLAAGDAVHRALPDPQPRHDRRLAGPRRPGRRVPGRGRRARRHVRAGVGAGGTASMPAARVLHRGVVDGAGGRRAARRRSTSRCGPGARGFGVAEFARRHGDFAIAGAVAAVELDGDDASPAPRSPCSAPPACRCGRRAAEAAVVGQPAGDARCRPSSARLAFGGIDDVADDPQVPAAYRRRVGVAMVADAWRRADGAQAAGRSTQMG